MTGGPIIGIDLGTTNSLAAVWSDGPQLIPNRLGSVLTPSAVSVERGGAIHVGLAARERQTTHPADTATAFKRYMGTSKRFTLGSNTFTPEDLSALVLRSLKEDAEAHLGVPVTEAVITVPAYFNDKQRKATRRAGELAGLKVERLINEPTAAALAYGIHEREDDKSFLVFDLGGGTFDVSIVEIFDGVIEVRASTGDNRLGGEDFNAVLAGMMRQHFAAEWGQKARDDMGLAELLRAAAERARRELSGGNAATMALVWRDKRFHYEVTADAFEAACADLIERLRRPVLQALRDGGLDPAGLAEIVLVGGATRMPIVRRAVTRMFSRFPNSALNPDEAIALGAAVQAGLKARNAALREVVLTDVCPFSLGVEISVELPSGGREDGVFSPIIERNTIVPVSRVQTYSTMRDNQTTVELGIYQGEARLVRDNVRIGSIDVPVPRGPRGQSIDCRFSYDINGLLEVDVLVHASGHRAQLVISDPDDTFSPAEVEKRRAALAALKVHPRETEANRAVLARAERCWADSLGETREMVGFWITQFNGALATQDARTADRAREELAQALDSLEGPGLQ
jgi:molecular chaperone HscC